MGFLDELRRAFRGLLQQRAFTATALLTLALGIGANTAMFSVADAVLLRPLAFPDADRLVSVWSTDVRDPQAKQHVSALDLDDLRGRGSSFDALAGWFIYEFSLVGSGDPARVKGVGVDGPLLALLGVAPDLGRTFSPGEDHVVVLSHGLWERQFASDPSVVGRSVTLNGESYAIVGVLPRGFRFTFEPEPVDLWATWDYSRYEGPGSQRDARVLRVIGRLEGDVTLEQAQAELDGIAAALREEYPDTNRDIATLLVPAVEELVARHRQVLLVLVGAVGCVLLITCVNVANLLLAKAAGRRREMAVRAALGASRARIVSQLLTESLVLALAGGVVGALAAMWGVHGVLALDPSYLPGLERVGVDGRAMVFTLLVSLATGVLFGLAPAWQASGVSFTSALRMGDDIGADGKPSNRASGALVVAELAAALVVVACASLLVNSFWRLRHQDPGFDPRNVLTFRVSLPYEQYDTARAAEFFGLLRARLQSVPGVRNASCVFPLPFNGDPTFDTLDVTLDTRLVIENRELPRDERPRIDSRTVQPDYFRAMGIATIRGREFSEFDDADAAPVAVISERLARMYFPDEDPIGKRIGVDSVFVPGQPPLRRIIGVVGNTKYRGLADQARAEVYVPFAQDPFQEMWVVVKTEIDPSLLVGAVRAAVLEMDARQPIYQVRTLDERLGISLAKPRFDAILLGLFAALALVIAVVGLYGVVSHAVARRTHEIGIRMALGASTDAVLGLVMLRGMRLVAAGLTVGLAAAVLGTRFLESVLFEVSTTDTPTLAVVTALFAVVAMVACWIPARRATKVDPLVAVRTE